MHHSYKMKWIQMLKPIVTVTDYRLTPPTLSLVSDYFDLRLLSHHCCETVLLPTKESGRRILNRQTHLLFGWSSSKAKICEGGKNIDTWAPDIFLLLRRKIICLFVWFCYRKQVKSSALTPHEISKWRIEVICQNFSTWLVGWGGSLTWWWYCGLQNIV